jgi:hypothetical protein
MAALRLTAIALAAGLAAAMLAGCASKITKSNYESVRTGMTLAQVEDILGKGTEQAGIGGALGTLSGSVKIVCWTEGDNSPKKITITFVNDKVAAKLETGL